MKLAGLFIPGNISGNLSFLSVILQLDFGIAEELRIDFFSDLDEFRRVSSSWTGHSYMQFFLDLPGIFAHNENTIAQKDGFINVMSNEDHCRFFTLPYIHDLRLHMDTRQRIY